eukprot:SAG31_NODE_4329_length_3349_cov_14.655385_2_plen_62_part_00
MRAEPAPPRGEGDGDDLRDGCDCRRFITSRGGSEGAVGLWAASRRRSPPPPLALLQLRNAQ